MASSSIAGINIDDEEIVKDFLERADHRKSVPFAGELIQPMHCKSHLINNTVYMLSEERDHNKFIEVGYDIFSNLQPSIKIGCLGCSDISDCTILCNDRRNCVKAITFSVDEWQNKLVNRETFFLQSVLNDFENEDNKIKEIVFGTMYRCRLYRSDFIELFKLKNIINYRLELLRSFGLPAFYKNFLKLVSELSEQGTEEGITSDAYLILNSELNINCNNILCVLEIISLYPENIFKAVNLLRGSW